MFDNFKNETNSTNSKIKRNVIITALAVATIITASVTIKNVVDNDAEFGSEPTQVITEVSMKDMGSYSVTLNKSTTVDAKGLLSLAINSSAGGITQLGSPSDLDFIDDSETKITFSDGELKRKYTDGAIKETIIVETDSGKYSYTIKVFVKEEATNATEGTTTTETEESTESTIEVSTEENTGEEVTSETEDTASGTTSNSSEVEDNTEEDEPVETTKPTENKKPVQQTEKPATTTAPRKETKPATTTVKPKPVETTPPATQPPTQPPVDNSMYEGNGAYGNLPKGNYSYLTNLNAIDYSAQVVYGNAGNGSWYVIASESGWNSFMCALNMESGITDSNIYKAQRYMEISRQYAGYDIVYVPSHWTWDDIYNNFGWEGSGSLRHGTYVDLSGDGTYTYIG